MRTCRVLLYALVAALLQVPFPAYASCADLSLQQRVERADAVFVGTVDGAGGPRAAVRVTDVYKGAVDATVRVDGGDPAGEDAVALQDGTQYVFLAQGERSQWSTDACLGTAPVTDRTLGQVEDLLGAPTSFRGVPRSAEESPKGTPATSATEPSASPGSSATQDEPAEGDGPGGSVIVGLLVVAVIASFVLPQMRRRRRRGSENVGDET